MAKRAKQFFDDRGHLIIKPYRMIDLCQIFDVTYRTMRQWIDECRGEIGERKGHYYNAEQVTMLVQRFGIPCIMKTTLKEREF